jgi:vancomycin permeability regulator SanA
MKRINPKMKAFFLKFKKHFKKLLIITIIGLTLIIGINIYVKNKTKQLIYNDINKVSNTNIGIIFEGNSIFWEQR